METLDTPAVMVPLIPGYATSRQLGHGSSSTVWLATRDKDGARFAVKCFAGGADDAAALNAAQVLQDVSREVKFLSGLKHEHLVRIHEVLPLGGTAVGALGIVMDYAAGGSLANLMSGRGRLSVGEAVTMLTPMAQVLDYLHASGAVHGDVSPGNILFTAEGMPVLADLGIAARVGETQQNLDVGTPGFLDPACALAGSRNSVLQELQPQRDVYSLAAVGWYCLTGTAPERAQHRPPLSLLVPEVPKTLAAALEAGLDPDPQLRPTARELGTAIFRSAAPEALDLSGAVHSSVIPELLTRRQTLGRSPRGTARWLKLWRWALPSKSKPALRPVGRPVRQRAMLKNFAIRVGLLMAAGVLIGAVSWAVWQQSQPPSHHAPIEGSVATPGQETALPHSVDLPEGLAQRLRSEDPAAAVLALSEVRDIALGQGRLDLLALVNAPGSPADAVDKQLGDDLREAGTVFAGLLTTLSGVTVEESSQADHVMVGVRATTSAYDERLASGAVVRSQAPGTPQEGRLHMVRSGGRWWISEILGPASQTE